LTEGAPPRTRVTICLAALGAFTLASTIGVAFFPYLLANNPLLLVGLSPLFRHVVVVSPIVPAASLFAVVVPRHFAVDPFVYFLGRDYGPAAILWIERNSPGIGRFVRTLERLFARIGPIAVMFSPEVVVSTLAGAARVPFPLFVVMNVVGTIGTVIVARWFGTALESQIQVLVAFVRAHVVSTTVASVLLAVLFNAWSGRKRRSGGGVTRVE